MPEITSDPFKRGGEADAADDLYYRIADWILSDGDSTFGGSPAEAASAALSGDGDVLPSPPLAAEFESAGSTPPSPPAEAVPEGERAAPRAWGFDVESINADYALVIMGSKAIVAKEQARGPIEERIRFLTVEAFNHWYSNCFTEVCTAEGKIKTVTWAQAWRQHPRRRQFDGVEFFPNPDGEPATPGYLNLWRGFGVTPSLKGEYHVFRDHLLNNVCNGDAALFNWVFGWIAHIFQRPRERLGTALVLRGGMGTGKSKVGEVVGSLIPRHYFQVDDARYVTGNFNAHMAACLLLQADEAVWAGDKAAEGRIKGLVTSEFQMIEAKGIDAIRIRNFVRLFLTSNEDWVIPAGMNERRFCVLDVNPQCAQRHDYFREMDAELDAGGRERLLHDLLNFDLSAVNLREIPKTAALLDQKMRSFDPLESWWFNRLIAGAQTRGLGTWQPEVACNLLYDDYLKFCDGIGAGRKRDPATFGRRLTKHVPGLAKARPRRALADGQQLRIQCYIFPDLAACREAFDRIVGQPCEWPVLPEGESEAGMRGDDDDDVVPF